MKRFQSFIFVRLLVQIETSNQIFKDLNMAVQQQLSGTIVVIIIAMAVQVCIMLVIVVKRQIMRFAIRNRRGPHTHIGKAIT